MEQFGFEISISLPLDCLSRLVHKTTRERARVYEIRKIPMNETLFFAVQHGPVILGNKLHVKHINIHTSPSSRIVNYD